MCLRRQDSYDPVFGPFNVASARTRVYIAPAGSEPQSRASAARATIGTGERT